MLFCCARGPKSSAIVVRAGCCGQMSSAVHPLSRPQPLGHQSRGSLGRERGERKQRAGQDALSRSGNDSEVEFPLLDASLRGRSSSSLGEMSDYTSDSVSFSMTLRVRPTNLSAGQRRSCVCSQRRNCVAQLPVCSIHCTTTLSH